VSVRILLQRKQSSLAVYEEIYFLTVVVSVAAYAYNPNWDSQLSPVSPANDGNDADDHMTSKCMSMFVWC